MKALMLAASLSLMLSVASAQIKTMPIDKKAIPADIHYSGHVIDAVRYSDKNGKHIVLTTETGVVGVKGNDELSKADLYAYQYDFKDGKHVLIWTIHDFAIERPVDVTCHFLKGTFAVTDLNNDGRAEVWVMYSTMCRGDVNPATLKIIMYENRQKFAVRGTSRTRVTDKDYAGGEYKFDEAFRAGPEVFRKYAATLWQKNMLEDNWR